MKLAVGEFCRQHASVSSHFSSVPPPSPFSSSSRSDAAFELRRSRLHHINRLFANYCGHSVTFLLLHFLLLQFIGPQHRQISTEKQHPPPKNPPPQNKTLSSLEDSRWRRSAPPSRPGTSWSQSKHRPEVWSGTAGLLASGCRHCLMHLQCSPLCKRIRKQLPTVTVIFISLLFE